MAGIDSTGLETKPIETILEEVSQEQTDQISDSLNTSSTSPLGQANASIANQLAALWELAQEAVAAQKPAEASGQHLTDVAELTGTIRNGATYSQVYATCTLTAGTYAAGDLVAHTISEPTARFANVEEVVSPGGAVTGILFQAEDAGPVRANSGTLTVIAESVAGWSAVTNPEDASLGALIESDTALRVRRAQEQARTGSATADAVRVDVADVEGVTYCVVLENDTDDVDGNGQDPHSLQVVVEGGDDQDVAAAIWASKAGGIKAFGTTTEAVTDEMGYSHTVGFTRPTETDVYLDIAFTVDTALYPGDSAVLETFVEWADANHTIGDDVVRTRLIGQLFAQIPGLIDVTTLEIGTTDGGEVSANLVIGPLARAAFDTGRIDLTATQV